MLNSSDHTKGRIEHIYQYANGNYLPDSSQPDVNNHYEITSTKYTPHSSTRYTHIRLGSNGVAQLANADGDYHDEDKILPKLYAERENCCGCAACCAICPMNAITMLPDEEGFLYPVVNAAKCVRCYKCMSICVIKDK